MKKVIAICLIVAIMFVGSAWAEDGAQSTANSNLDALLYQFMYGPGYSEGGDATAESGSIAVSGGSTSGATANISTTSISKPHEMHTPPLGAFPPYLPYWSHGGWGSLKTYFPGGPSGDDKAYERVFNVVNCNDTRELRNVLESLSHEGPLEVLEGILNGIGTVFGGPDNFHHGRGFDIKNSLSRVRRPQGKSLLVLLTRM